MKLNLKALSLSLGLVWAGAVFLTTLLSIFTGYGEEFLDLIASLYPGFTVSWAGSIIGLIYAFVDGFISALIFGLFYNSFIKVKP